MGSPCHGTMKHRHSVIGIVITIIIIFLTCVFTKNNQEHGVLLSSNIRWETYVRFQDGDLFPGIVILGKKWRNCDVFCYHFSHFIWAKEYVVNPGNNVNSPSWNRALATFPLLGFSIVSHIVTSIFKKILFSHHQAASIHGNVKWVFGCEMSFLAKPARICKDTLDLETSSAAVEFRLRTVIVLNNICYSQHWKRKLRI